MTTNRTRLTELLGTFRRNEQQARSERAKAAWARRKAKPKAAKKKRNRVTYFTRRHLIDCAKAAERWDYNRQLSDDVAELPDLRFPVLETLNHSHRHGVPCEPHVRCVVLLRPGRYLIVDVPSDYFAALPSFRFKP